MAVGIGVAIWLIARSMVTPEEERAYVPRDVYVETIGAGRHW